MTRFRWGIFGTGTISGRFVAGLTVARNAEVAFIASRSLKKAEAFAAQWGVRCAIAGYAEAAAAGGVDAIYIATPPSVLAEHALLAIAAGIPVLVEKPFATSTSDAKRVVDAARAKSVFAMEAMWTRFLPAAQALRDKVAAGAIGDVRLVVGSFGTSQALNSANAMFNLGLGGGAISYLGAYPLSLGHWLFGAPTVVQVTGTVGSTGVDEDAAFHLRYAGDIIGSYFVSIRAWAQDDFQVLGTDGIVATKGSIVRPSGLYLSRESPHNYEVSTTGLKVRIRQHPVVHYLAQRVGRAGRNPGSILRYPYAGNGYHYEADEVQACLARGAIESAIMPLDETIAIVATAETIRKAISGSSTE